MKTPIGILWDELLVKLQIELSQTTFENWIRRFSVEHCENDCFVTFALKQFICICL